MSDFLLAASQNPGARSLIKALGLPIPLPEPLRRERGPWSARPLADRRVIVFATPGAELTGALADTLAAAGADVVLSVPPALAALYRDPGETFGRPPRSLDSLADKDRAHAIVLDASGIRTVAELRAVYDAFHATVGRLGRSGRVLVLAREGAQDDAEADAAGAALEGFVRSLAKEIGRLGATANLVRVEKGAESRLGPALRFLLSSRSAFVSAQPLTISKRAKELREPALVRSLEKKIAVVTGAARGIGESTARALAAEGAHVVLVDRPSDDGPLSQLARELSGTAVAVDITDVDAASTIAAAVKSLGGLDILVHNAGITRDKTLARMSAEQWDGVLDVNLGAVVRVTRALEPLLRDYARIVCLSSIAGLAGNVGQTAYAASKAGIVGFVRGASERLADRGITVNAVAPGFIETRMTAAIPMAIREVARRLSALSQGGQPEDVAQAITFLASPGAQGVTGKTLRVCGGAFVGA